MPRISIVIPLYNAGSTIQSTINSALNQSFQDFEIVIINDGSTDDSAAIVKTIADNRIRLFTYENAGGATARNRGIEAAKGEFVAFLDADDIWHPDKLYEQITLIQQHPDVALVHSWTDYIDEAGKIICPGGRPIAGDDSYEKLLVANFLENGSTPLIRRGALINIGGFNPVLAACQDTDLYLRLAKIYKFKTVPKVHVYYRMRSSSISDNLARHEEQSRIFIDQVFANAPDNLQHLKRLSLAHYYRYLMLRGVEGDLTPKRGRQIARLLWFSIYYNPHILQTQPKLLTTVLAKAILAFLPDLATRFFLSFTHRKRLNTH